MDKTDQVWFNEFGRISCPKLTHIEFENIVDNLENASTRTLISLDEARTLLPNIDDLHLKTVFEYWNERRTTRVYFFIRNSRFLLMRINLESSDFFIFLFYRNFIRTND